MIHVHTADHDAGVRLVVTGHAAESEATSAYAAGVCAGVSALLATTLQYVHGSLDAGTAGHFDYVFGADELALGAWTFTGLDLIAEIYPACIAIERTDTRLAARRRSV